MAFNKEDVIEIVSILDDYYVRKSTCSDIQKGICEDFAEDRNRLTSVEGKASLIVWLLKAIATATIGTLVTSVLALVLRMKG